MKRHSFRIGRVLGIDVRLHYLTALLLLGGLLSSPSVVVGLVLLFGFVLLHELGHCLTALRFGVRVESVVLTPLGGLAGIEPLPRRPSVEFLVALAGPAVNAVCALLLLPLAAGATALATSGDARAAFVAGSLREPLVALVAVNAMLAGFNLLPVYPMDGSRILRAMLGWAGLGYRRATDVVARIGKVLAVAMGAVGLVVWWSGQASTGLPLLLVALFCWFAGEQERRQIRWLDARGLGGPSTYGDDGRPPDAGRVSIPRRREGVKWIDS